MLVRSEEEVLMKRKQRILNNFGRTVHSTIQADGHYMVDNLIMAFQFHGRTVTDEATLLEMGKIILDRVPTAKEYATDQVCAYLQEERCVNIEALVGAPTESTSVALKMAEAWANNEAVQAYCTKEVIDSLCRELKAALNK